MTEPYDEFDGPQDDDDERESQRSGIVSESLRKLFVTGASAIFMTEEGVRKSLSDLRLPKEVVHSLLQQTDRSRKEVIRVVGDELKRYLRALDLPGEIRKSLSGMTVELEAKIRFVDDDKVETKVTRKTRKTKPSDGASNED